MVESKIPSFGLQGNPVGFRTYIGTWGVLVFSVRNPGARRWSGRYYRTDLEANALVSTEITGYAVSALVYLHRKSGDDGLLQAAKRSGRFLAETAWDDSLGIFPFEHSNNGVRPQPLAFFFDCGIIVRGLLALWRETAEERILDVAVKAGLAMGRDFAGAGLFHPILRLPGKQPLPHEAQWSRRPGCYQLKSAMAWHDLEAVTGIAEFGAWYDEAVSSALASKDQFLPAATPEQTMDRLHAYCYFLEGLMPVAGRQDCRAAIEEGIARAAGYLRDIAPVFERSDVYAQLLRARIYAKHLAGVTLDETMAAEEAEKLSQFQCGGEDARIRGGCRFGRRGSEMLPHVNPVSTAFCLQAADLWEARSNGLRLETHALI